MYYTCSSTHILQYYISKTCNNMTCTLVQFLHKYHNTCKSNIYVSLSTDINLYFIELIHPAQFGLIRPMKSNFLYLIFAILLSIICK